MASSGLLAFSVSASTGTLEAGAHAVSAERHSILKTHQLVVELVVPHLLVAEWGVREAVTG